MTSERRDFCRRFRSLRNQQALSFRQLEEETGTKFSSIAAMAAGKRPVDGKTAEGLADAFKLSGQERDKFLNAALATRQEDRLTKESKQYPPQVVNYASRILANRIPARAIKHCNLTFSTPSSDIQGRLKEDFDRLMKSVDNEQSSRPMLELSLTDGTTVFCCLLVA